MALAKSLSSVSSSESDSLDSRSGEGPKTKESKPLIPSHALGSFLAGRAFFSGQAFSLCNALTLEAYGS